MADLTAIRDALASQISAQTGLRAIGQVKDQISPPIALILPGSPLITYGATLSGGGETEVVISLAVLLLMSDAAPTEQVQVAMDAYLGIGAGEPMSIAQAIAADISLGKTVEWCLPVSVTTYGRIEYAGINFFGAKLNVSAGAG